MKNDAKEPREMTQVGDSQLRLQEKTNIDKEYHFTGNPVLETAFLRGLIRKSVLRNPRYLLVMRRLRFLAYRSAQESENTGNSGEKSRNSAISKILEHLDPQKIFSN